MPIISEEEVELNMNVLLLITKTIIEMTMEKLKHIEWEERFRNLFDKAPLGYQSLDFDGYFIDVNQKWLDTLGYSKEEVIGKWFGDFLCPEYVAGFRKRFPIFKSQGYINSEFEMMHKDGQRMFIAFDGKIGYDSNGKFKQTHCILQDITEQKKAEKALIESEAKYRTIIQTTQDGFWIVDAKGQIVEVNDAYCRMSGYTRKELIGMKIEDLDMFETSHETAAHIKAAMEKGYDLFETRHKKRDGSTFDVEVSANFLDSNSTFFVFCRDITERKQIEEALHQSEERFRVVQEISPDGFTILHPVRDEAGEIIDFVWVYENLAVAQINQTDPQKVIGKRLLDLFPTHRGTSIFEAYKQVARTGKSQIIEEVNVGEIVAKPVWLRLAIVSMGEDIAILNQNISERKQAEEDSHLHAYMFQSLFNEMSTGAAIYKVLNDGQYGKDYIIQDFNNAALKAERKEKAEVLGKSLYDLRPNIDQYGLISLFQQVWKTGEPANYPAKIYVDENFSNWYENRVYKLPSGEIAAIFDDVTEKRQAEEALKASETQYRRLFESAKDGIIILDYETGMIQDVNPFLIELLGYTKEQFVDKAIWDMGAFEHLIANRDRYSELRNRAHFVSQDRPLQTAAGALIDVEFYSHMYLVNEKKLIQCNIRNITDRKKTERALYESEKKYRSYVENAPEGVFVADEKGKYVDVNNAATMITGYSKEELLNMNIRDITGEESWESAKAGFMMLLETGIMSGEAQYMHKNGEKRWLSIDAVKLDENRYMGFVSDITEKKMTEGKLLYLSYHDHLTDIHNRRYFEQKLKDLDSTENLPLSIIMCDVNGLKLVNDSFGHDSGDRLLKKTAETIKKVCREGDIVARVGGDEFVLLLPKTSANESVEIANRMKDLASEERVESIELSISYGYATKTTNSQSIIEIIANAENHMYRHKLYERSSIRSKTTDLIMKTLFEKSNREALHSNRVSSICMTIASKMNMDKDSVEQMRIAGLIHDIGKIGVAENILNKIGSLTIDERRDIERHPEIGWRLLSSSNEFSELARFVLCHHEKWDGSGYPSGIKGERIPIEARIINVADAYDAMTSERSYRKAVTKNEAIQELMRCSGTQFDPDIVDVFVKQVLMVENFDTDTGSQQKGMQ